MGRKKLFQPIVSDNGSTRTLTIVSDNGATRTLPIVSDNCTVESKFSSALALAEGCKSFPHASLKGREDREEKCERPQAIGLLDGHKIRVGGVGKRAIVEQVLRRQSEGEEP